MYAVIFHAHQKIDRVAYHHFRRILGDATFFAPLRYITHFEGKNGPDAVKLKNQRDGEQPWHFVDPFDSRDTALHVQITNHYQGLVKALKARDEVRAAFEAAWLAHALVDGLTPAHHYPYEQELETLRGDSRHSRKGLIGRAYVKGDTRRQSMQRSLSLIGPKGLLTTHALFEAGAYTIMAPLRLERAMPAVQDLASVRSLGVVTYFKRLAKEIAVLGLYERFYKKGWTPRLSRDIRRELAPRMVMMVTLAWYAAVCEAGLVPAPAAEPS